MSTSMATTSTWLPRQAFVEPLLASSTSSRSYVVIPRAVAKKSDKASVSVSSKDGRRFGASKVTVADGNVRDVIEAEIEALQESGNHKKPFDFPKFPFEIIDNPGEKSIILKREINRETITLKVLPDFEDNVGFEDYDDNANYEDEEEEEEDEDEDADVAQEEIKEETGRPGLTVTVTVEKGEGPFLEFVCSFGESGFFIDSLAMKKTDGSDTEKIFLGPEFSELDEGLQDAFQRYLEVRGVRNPMFNLLTDYMMNKEVREYLMWLKNIRRYFSK